MKKLLGYAPVITRSGSLVSGGCHKHLHDDEICHCKCHGPGGNNFKHLVPCCYRCEKCGEMIEKSHVLSHQSHCTGKVSQSDFPVLTSDAPSTLFNDISHVDDGDPAR